MIRYKLGWKKDESGVVAIEFALIVPVLLIFIIGLLELAMMFTAATVLEGVTVEASRLVRTGQAQKHGGDPRSFFQAQLCDHPFYASFCNDIQFTVERITDNSFSGAKAQYEAGAVFDEDWTLSSAPFDPGGPNELVMVTVMYRYPILTPLMQTLLVDSPDNTKLLMSTVVFKNEPYEFNVI